MHKDILANYATYMQQYWTFIMPIEISLYVAIHYEQWINLKQLKEASNENEH